MVKPKLRKPITEKNSWLLALNAYLLISASTKLNGHSCFCKNWFSLHQRAEGEAILVFIHQQITSVCYRKPRNDVDFFALALLVIHYQNVNIRLILWNYLCILKKLL